jgi:hypothetical protein
MALQEELFTSPELYPLKVDFQRRIVTFVRMSRVAYETCLFASFAAARRLSSEAYEIRLDDALLAAASASTRSRRAHYILHTAYCCSTLLARYYELVPSCFVLREPPLLAQMATSRGASFRQWNETLDLSIKLLTRTFSPDQFAVIKTHVPCNALGRQLLDHNDQTTITFLMTPLRSFLFAVLKSEKRCQRVRLWNQSMKDVALRCPGLEDLDPSPLTDAQAAAYWWIITHFLCRELSSGANRSRVSVLDGEQLAVSPKEALPPLLRACGLRLHEDKVKQMIEHPSLQKHSKHPSQPYDASTRQDELATLEGRFGAVVEDTLSWMDARGIECDFPLVSC